MPQPIFFRVGTEDRISLGAFIDALRNFLMALKDMDATISANPMGSVRWDVTTLQKSSPPLVGVTPSQRKASVLDHSYKVESQFIENLRLLSTRAERNDFLSDSALDRIEKLAKRTSTIGPMAAWLPSNGLPKMEGEISSTTLQNVTELTGVKFSGFGSITGKLESISVHNGDEFRVWDKKTGKPIRCKYKPAIEQQIKDALRKSVVVVGTILMNSSGNPISMDVEEIEEANQRTTPLSVDQLSGAIKDFTGGRPLREFLEENDDD
jgi:hypothetical protein